MALDESRGVRIDFVCAIILLSATQEPLDECSSLESYNVLYNRGFWTFVSQFS